MQGRVGGGMAKKTLVFSPFAHDFDFPGFSLLPVKRVGSGEESQKEEEASTEFPPLRPQFCQKKRERKYAALCSLPVSHTHFRKRGLHSFKRFFSPVQRHLCNAKDFFSQCVLRLRPRRREQKAKLNSPPDTMYCIRHQNRISRCLFFSLSFFWGMCGGQWRRGKKRVFVSRLRGPSVAAAENRAKRDAKGVWEEYHVLFPPSLTSIHPFP